MTNQKLKVGDRVTPNTPCNVTYGYVRKAGLAANPGNIPGVLVYWPEIRGLGLWPERDLRK